MYRYVYIDLSVGADVVCSDYSIGRDSEEKATALRVKLPDKFINSNIVFEFEISDGSSYTSKLIPFAEEIVYELPAFLMVEGSLSIGVVAIDATNGSVVKPFLRTFVVSYSINALKKQGIPYGVALDHETRIKKLEEGSCEHENLYIINELAETEDKELVYSKKTLAFKEYVDKQNDELKKEVESSIEEKDFLSRDDVSDIVSETVGLIDERLISAVGSGVIV